MSNLPARIYFRVSFETTTEQIHAAIDALELFRIRSIETTPIPEIHKKDIIVFVDKWYNGTRPLRERLISGGYFLIPNGIPGREWGARMHEYPKPATRNIKGYTRENYDDIIYSEPVPLLYSNRLPPGVSDNREERLRRNLSENQEAMDAFIREWLPTFYEDWREQMDNTPEKPMQGATAPGAPAKPAMPRRTPSDVDIDSITMRLEDMFVDNTIHVPDEVDNSTNYTAIENAIRCGNIVVRRRKIGKRPVKKT
jgi:hypothetical protein